MKTLTTIIEGGDKYIDNETENGGWLIPLFDDILPKRLKIEAIKSIVREQQTIAYNAAIEEVREKIKILRIKDEEMPIGTDFGKCDSYNDGIRSVLSSLEPHAIYSKDNEGGFHTKENI